MNEPTKPNVPTMSPIFLDFASFFSFVIAAVNAVGTVVIKEIPWATTCSNPPNKTSRGILIIPPPIPSNPEPIPDTKPITKNKYVF